MKEMVLRAGQRRRLLRATVVGGIGSATGRSGRPSGTDQAHEQQQDVRPDTGLASSDELRAAERRIRRG